MCSIDQRRSSVEWWGGGGSDLVFIFLDVPIIDDYEKETTTLYKTKCKIKLGKPICPNHRIWFSDLYMYYVH